MRKGSGSKGLGVVIAAGVNFEFILIFNYFKLLMIFEGRYVAGVK